MIPMRFYMKSGHVLTVDIDGDILTRLVERMKTRPTVPGILDFKTTELAPPHSVIRIDKIIAMQKVLREA